MPRAAWAQAGLSIQFCQSVSQSVNVLNILWANQFIMNKYNVEGKDSHTWPSVCPMEVKTFPFTAFPAISVQVCFNSTSRILGCTGLYMPSHMLVSIRTRLYIYMYTYVRGFHLTYPGMHGDCTCHPTCSCLHCAASSAMCYHEVQPCFEKIAKARLTREETIRIQGIMTVPIPVRGMCFLNNSS